MSRFAGVLILAGVIAVPVVPAAQAVVGHAAPKPDALKGYVLSVPALRALGGMKDLPVQPEQFGCETTEYPPTGAQPATECRRAIALQKSAFKSARIAIVTSGLEVAASQEDAKAYFSDKMKFFATADTFTTKGSTRFEAAQKVTIEETAGVAGIASQIRGRVIIGVTCVSLKGQSQAELDAAMRCANAVLAAQIKRAKSVK